MRLDRDTAREVFKVNELIPSGGRRTNLRILELSDSGMRIQSTGSQSSKFFTYKYLQIVIDGFDCIIPESVHVSIQPVLKSAGEKESYWTENYAYGIARAFRERNGVDTEALADTLPSTRQGFMSSPAVRKAIEEHSVELARKHFKALDYFVETHGKPFDLLCTRGQERLYVEVKGTQGSGAEILLTKGEVN